ncbi:MAG: polyphosphate kinase 2 [Saprospiraceae bacterium]|nr:polyphosphate kinase 2 [Saprospiraceae bacterium]
MRKESIEEHYQINQKYIPELYLLQVELVKLQKYISENRLRMLILFEGRDTAGKGSAIFRFTQFLNPREYRVVALGKPSETQRGQWYFQRYLKELPNAGEMVFFDRSWYNRGVVEPVMGFCSETEHQLFMKQVNQVEKLLVDDGIMIIKFWFSIESETQAERIKERLMSPLKRWKVSPVDLAAQEKWDDFTQHKLETFNHTHTRECPWMIIRCEEREYARIQAMRYVLSLLPYEGKSEEIQNPDNEIIFPYMPY